MKNSEFKTQPEERTKNFAVLLIHFLYNLPQDRILSVLVNQLTKSGTSIGANYREANRAESKKDFIHKIGITEKEASETLYWLELLIALKFLNNSQREQLKKIQQESNELLALFTSISRSSRSNLKKN